MKKYKFNPKKCVKNLSCLIGGIATFLFFEYAFITMVIEVIEKYG